MTTATLKHLESMLPWDDLPSDRDRKRRITIVMLLLAFVMSVSIPFIKVPKQSRAEAEAVPERIARVVERKVELPPPPPPPPKEEPKPEEKPKVEEKIEKPVEKQQVEVTKAREKASKLLEDSGLNELQDMASAFDLPTPTGGLITSTQEAGAGATSRALLTSKAGTGSGTGGYAGTMSAGTGGKPAGKGSATALAGGGKLQTVQSGIGAAAAAQAASRVGKDGKARRSTEDIRKVFDRYGARLNNLYQRALRDDPTMQGTVVLKLTVAPDGSVTAASVQSSQLNNPDLEAKIAALVRGFNFGAMEVEPWTGTYDVNFMTQ